MRISSFHGMISSFHGMIPSFHGMIPSFHAVFGLRQRDKTANVTDYNDLLLSAKHVFVSTNRVLGERQAPS